MEDFPEGFSDACANRIDHRVVEKRVLKVGSRLFISIRIHLRSDLNNSRSVSYPFNAPLKRSTSLL
jgi:hypothetical protein